MGKTDWQSITADLPDMTSDTWATAAEIAAARRNVVNENFQVGNAITTGDLLVDRNAVTSRDTKGLWVSAWIWLDNGDIDGEGPGLPLADAKNQAADPIEEMLRSNAERLECILAEEDER